MTPDLKDIHHLFEHLIDEGATYASIQAKIYIKSRHITWGAHKHQEKHLEPFQHWTLRVLTAGHWGVVSAPSFSILQKQQHMALEMAKESSLITGLSKSSPEVLHPKPVRQMRAQAIGGQQLQPTEDLLVDIKRISDVFQSSIRSDHRDTHIHSLFWDSEHARGSTEFINRSLKIILQEEDKTENDILLHHVTALPQKESEQQSSHLWQKEIKRWANTLEQMPYSGPSPEDFCWIFSHRATAQLVQHTLGPTLCLQRPDPFLDAMNPSSLNDSKITPDILTIYSQPSLFQESSFLDAEGVPVRQLPLIESGAISNFVLTRSSAHHLGRSLPVNKEKYLAGSARHSIEHQSSYPDLKAIDIQTGESLEKDFRLSHLYINDLDISPLDGGHHHFLITAKNVLVNKFSGMHRRHIRRLQFQVTRDQLWQQLLGLGQDSLSISLPPSQKTIGEPYSIFNSPMAKFRGFPCIWH